MNSPVAHGKPLKKVTLEEGLVAFQCLESEGIYIRLEDYWAWKHSQPSESPNPPDTTSCPTSEYDDQVKLCPETGSLMSRFKVGHGLDFRVDRSTTGGVWLDAGEWESLRAGNLHRTLHLVFTSPWQKAIRDESLSEKRAQRLKERLGDDFYKRLTELRQGLWAHDHHAEALAFIQERPR